MQSRLAANTKLKRRAQAQGRFAAHLINKIHRPHPAWQALRAALWKGVQGRPESSELRSAHLWRIGFSFVRRSVDKRERPSRRISFHIASPAVELPQIDSLTGSLGLDSGSQYNHWPWSLHIRPCNFPLTRSLKIEVRRSPSLTDTCLTVSHPASSNRSFKLFILAE